MNHPCPVPLPRYSLEQGRALEHIGTALAQRCITWDEALTLRELVQGRFVRSALKTLENRIRHWEAA